MDSADFLTDLVQLLTTLIPKMVLQDWSKLYSPIFSDRLIFWDNPATLLSGAARRLQNGAVTVREPTKKLGKFQYWLVVSIRGLENHSQKIIGINVLLIGILVNKQERNIVF